MGKLSCAFAALVSLAFFFYHCSALKYQTGKTYKYIYSTAVLFNDLNSRRLTKAQKDVGLRITLDVDVSPIYQDADSQLFKLKLNSAKVVSASRENQEKPLGSLLKHPVYFELEKNSVGKIFIPQSDPAFCSNIKKGIISLFQVQDEPGERTEIDISGECSVQYTKPTSSTISKTKTDCKNLELAGQYSNTNKALGVNVLSTTTQEYTIEDDIIKSVTGTDTVKTNLNIRSDLNGEAIVSHQLNFQNMIDNSATVTASDIEDAIKSLQKETGSTLLPSLLPSVSEVAHCTENCESPLKLIPKLHDDLKKEQLASLPSAKAFVRMLRSFRNSGKETIAKVLTSKDSYLIVPQLIDVAAATQTSAALKAVMELLVFDDDYSTQHPERFLLAATYSTHPREFLLKNLLSVLKKNIPSESLKESLMLATSAIVHTYCQVKDKCSTQVVQDVRKLLLTGLSKCAEEACTAMYLRALGNAGLPGTVMTIVTHAEQANISMVSEMAIKALRRVDRQFITEEVTDAMLRIFHQNEKTYDTSVRLAALNVVLQNGPSVSTLRSVLLAITDQTNHELAMFIKQQIEDAANQDQNLRSTLQSIYQERKINNYNVLAQRGKSSVFTNFLARTSDMHATYRLIFENSNVGVMKRSGMDVNLVGNSWTQPFLDFSIFAEGLESMMSDESSDEAASEDKKGGEEEESGVESMAGMSFMLMDVVLKQVEFFRGMSGLMSAVWNAPSELTSALQGNLLLQDHSQRVHLSNGLIMNVAVTGVLSMDLSGYVSISLWNRNCDSLIKNSGAIYIEGSMQLESSEFTAGVEFSGEGASAIDFMTIAEFYDMPVKLCLQMKRPDFTFRQTLKKFERISGSKKYIKKITKRSSFPGESYLLNKANSEECKNINEAQE